MSDRISEYIISLGGDDKDLRAVFSAFKARARSDVAELEAITAKVDLFKGTEDRAAAASAAFFKARDAAATYRAEIARIEAQGGKVGDDLIKSLQTAEKAAASASREYNRQTDQLTKLGASLKRAGVDTANLAAEQARLAQASKLAAAAATEQDARQVLGLKTLRDISPEIQRLNAAYNTLRASGTLSFKELALAQQQVVTRTAELRGQLTGVGGAVKGVDLAGFFQRSILPALGVTASVAGVVSVLKTAIQTAKDFQQGLAEISTVSNLTGGQLTALGAGARQLAQELGLNVNEALKAIFELLRSGVPQENVLEVLRVSAEASKASLTDLGTTVKVSNLLLDAFGADISDLPILFDKLIKGAHDGGATLKEFAEGGGALLNVARAAGISFDELAAVLTVLVDKSGNAEKSMGDLTKIIAKLDTADARNKLRELGITGDSLVDIFGQIGERGLSLGEVLGLNLTGAGVKSAASLATLTSNAKELPAELDRITKASGETAKSLATMLDTPTGRSARFSAAVDEWLRGLGELAGTSSKAAVGVTTVLNTLSNAPSIFDVFSGSLNRAVAQGTLFDNSTSRWVATLFGVPVATKAAKGAIDELALAQRIAKKEAEAAAALVKKANADLTDFSAKLLADIQAIQAASTRDIADATARADAQIAALDRSKAAETATAAATLDIQLKLAADRLAIIKDAEAKITAAVNFEIDVREKAARAAGDSQKKIAGDSANARIAALAPVLAQYQQHYNALVALSENYAAKARSAEQSRVEILQSVAAARRAIALEELSGLDLFVAKQREVDRLISEGRQKATEGDIAAAKQFFDQAIAESNGLAKVIDENGVEIVTGLQARSAKLEALKKISDAVNESIGDQGKAAADGANRAIEAANSVGVKIKELQTQYDALKATAAEGLTMKVQTDAASVAEAFATLNKLTADRTVNVRVNVIGGGIPGSPNFVGPPPPEGFTRGGFVRKFAAGGHVFRNPNWSKVPGTGNQDTVPALLQAGSFVVRKSASQLYGDGIMAGIARYASGGAVSKEAVAKWAETNWGYNPFAGRTDTGGAAPIIDPKLGFRSGDSFQGNEPPVSIDTRPIPEQFLTAVNVIAYAREMLNMVGSTNPMLGSLLPQIESGITALDRNPLDKDALTRVLQAAETIGSNPYLFAMYGKTQSAAGVRPAEWFLDWLALRGLVNASGNTFGAPGIPGGTGGGIDVGISDFAQRFFSSAVPRLGNPLLRDPTFANSPLLRFFTTGARFDSGGSAGDTVPALLTPGEWVIPKPAVQRLGSRFLEALNSTRIDPSVFANFAAYPPMPRFAAGGAVAGADIPAWPSGRTQGRAGALIGELHIHGAPSDFKDQSTIRRLLLPALREIERRSKDK